MSSLLIEGGNRIDGEFAVQGAKNAVLPILAATVLNGGKNVVYNCPDLSDVSSTVEVLENLGCSVSRHGNILNVDSSGMNSYTIPETLMRKMRSSIIFLGAIIARYKRACVSMPGGCEIGLRPIDLHLKALKSLGIEISEAHGYINCVADKITGADIHLDFPSVGATENIMLAACMADGITTIENAAREPEIVDLQNFLNRMGAKISGGGGNVIRIEGVKKLYGVEHTIMPDRIVSGTYLVCAAATRGHLVLTNTDYTHMGAILNLLSDMGCRIYREKNRIAIACNQRTHAVPTIKTMPYPGFPTDIQSPFMSLAAISDGTSIFVENIFENRYQHVDELTRMGADIRIDGRCAVVIGTKSLTGANVVAKDLRGGAALVAAALAAEGNTTIENVHFIDRGYENIEKYLALCGANITRKE
ncbi:MAG: UDP-N-acetylglucosamine 1-carboxyvinyltransferase [Eubacteriales bacterium]|nr:UDP-N-acetylglucosamine 1-carboxyvinyltransferase [Eubacteriales bacterium]